MSTPRKQPAQPPETAPAETAGIYCRLSLARFGDTTKVDDQARICRQLAAAKGWHVPEEFVWKDNNKSAWRIGVRRRGWEEMLAAVEAGLIRNLVVYHGDRMVRQPYDLEILIKLARGRGMTITSPTGTRRFDVPEDVAILGILANMARLESENTSRRKKSGFERMALRGVAPAPAGRFGRGFGYDRDGRTPIPAEAAAVREAAARVLAGESLAGIAASLADRGVMSVSGQPLNYDVLRRILTRPRIAGLLKDGTPGSWEPVLERETWETVGAVLRSRGTAINPSPTREVRHLLSGIAECGVCGRRLAHHKTGRAGGGPLVAGYGCLHRDCRKVHRNMAMLDAYVTGRVVRRLNSARLARALAQPRDDPFALEIAQLETSRAQARAVAEDLAAHPGADLAMLARAVESFTRRIAELRAARLTDASHRVIASHLGITRERFTALPIATRRALVAATFRVIVLPSSRRGGRQFNPEDVRMVRRGPGA